MELKKGQIIKAEFLRQPAKVLSFEEADDHYQLELVEDGQYHELRITEEQLQQIEILKRDEIKLTNTSEEFFALVEANRIRLAYQFDPLLAVSTSQVDPLPHQIEAVYNYILESPRVRFLLADDPGAGKTIMAGLVLKELQYRGLADRILIAVPGHLKYQWQREMKEKFNTRFRIINRDMFRAAWAENVWEENNLAISSVDFLKQEEMRNTLNSSHWDLIIVDEAHKMSAYKYGSKTKKTQRYRVGEILSKISDHLLFLTATPHRGDDENFRLFLDLLRPAFFARVSSLHEAIRNKENPLFLRRLKEDMKDFHGKKLFLPRKIRTVKHKMTSEEVELYNEVTNYVVDYYNRAKENRNITFAMMLLQRRLTSSTYAIEKSLERRFEKLEELRRIPERLEDPEYKHIAGLTEEELEDMEDFQRENMERRLEQLTIAKNIEEVEEEIVEIQKLLEKVRAVRKQEIESKLAGLRDDILAQLDGRKLLIFTQFRDTLTYLEDSLRMWGYQVTTIHGGMDMYQRIAAEKEFKDETQILIGTEAAGEGINLQFCSLMVNYDIPWNPNRLEQRMGRIHRYGQKKEVLIWNMISRGTREGQILSRLFEKMEKMRKALGSDKVFDIIGEIVPGKNLKDLFTDAIFEQKSIEEIEDQIDSVNEEEVKQAIERAFSTSLASRHIDYHQLNKQRLRAEENRLVPEYIEDYFLRVFRRLGGKIKKGTDHYCIDSVPYEIIKLNDNYDFKTRYGPVYKRYPKITFEKDIAREKPKYEFVAPSHPLLEAVNTLILEKFPGGLQKRAAFVDPKGQWEGLLWFLKGEIIDGTGEAAGRRVFCLHQNLDGTIQKINPAILWDLEYVEEGNISIPEGTTELFGQEELVKNFATKELLFPYKDEITKNREKEAEIKRKYGLRSIDYLISESNQKLLDYEERKERGEDMDLAIRREEQSLRKLEERKKSLKEEIRLQSNLTVSSPEFIGVAAVVPAVSAKEEEPKEPTETAAKMKTDKVIEDVGMRVAFEYEKTQGWGPEDVSQDNYGFDVRSTKYSREGVFEDIRYIEVKARAQSGAIRLSSNEWKKARHFKEKFWLYVVTEAGTPQPELHRIHNPVDKFTLGEDIFASGYRIPLDKWQKAREK